MTGVSIRWAICSCSVRRMHRQRRLSDYVPPLEESTPDKVVFGWRHWRRGGGRFDCRFWRRSCALEFEEAFLSEEPVILRNRFYRCSG
jgi:hypothetical protein